MTQCPTRLYLMRESVREHEETDATAGPGRAPIAGDWHPVAGNGRPLEALEVPDGVSFVALGTGAAPVLSSGEPLAGRDAFAIEPVWDGPAPRLLLISPVPRDGSDGRAATVNGQQAPRLTLLSVRDQLTFESCPYVLHVTRFRPASLGPASEAVAGRKCPICLARIEVGKPIYTCWGCGASVHWAPHPAGEAEAGSEEDELDCIRPCTACPSCGQEVVLGEGFTYFPEA